jgi:hypothetical protein
VVKLSDLNASLVDKQVIEFTFVSRLPISFFKPKFIFKMVAISIARVQIPLILS